MKSNFKAMQVDNTPRFTVTVDNSEPLFEQLLSESQNQIFDILRQLNGLMLQQNSPTVDAFVDVYED